MTNLDKPKNLQKKLARLSFFIISISLITIAIVFTIHSNNQARENLRSDMQVLAQVIGNRSAAALVFRDSNSAKDNLSSISQSSSVVKACLYDASGELFSDFVTKAGAQTCNAKLIERVNDHIESRSYLSVTYKIEDSGELLGFISIHASTIQIRESLTRALAVSLLAFFVIIAIAQFLINRSIRRILTPLTDLHQTALKISREPFSSLRASPGKNDEVGRLIDVFNNMLDTLGQHNQALTASENRFRSLAKNSPTGIFEMDTSGSFTYVNEKWQELTGLKEHINHKDYRRFVSSKYASLYDAAFERVQETGKSHVAEYRFLPAHSDEDRIFLEYITPVRDKSEGNPEISGFIGSLLDISELKNAQVELERLAFYDPLTNLPNRRFFMDHLKHVLPASRTDESSIAIMMLDLDNFKKVNDTLGHAAGDKLLSVLAERMRGLISQQDVICRMGGDEFLILVQNINIRSSIMQVADRILKALEKPINLQKQVIEMTASIGIATYPEDANTAEGLIRNADLALYLSKDSGRNRVSFFSKKLETLIQEKVRLERKMRNAIKSEAFTFFIQPQWSFHTQQVTSAEVLLRWFDEDDGNIPPDQFIPLAEETGLIIDIGEWLLKRVIQWISENQNNIETLGIESIAINLSARQFFSQNLATTIDELLEEYNLPPKMIELELTESAVMEDSELAVEIMNRLKSIGCKISIDDFGTGYSSLSYLKKFPIDGVKIDRSFISDIPNDTNDMAISSAVIAMGHNLGLSVIAEGVETEEQLSFLLERGCDYAQGYYIARPMPFEDFTDSIAELNKNPDAFSVQSRNVS